MVLPHLLGEVSPDFEEPKLNEVKQNEGKKIKWGREWGIFHICHIEASTKIILLQSVVSLAN